MRVMMIGTTGVGKTAFMGAMCYRIPIYKEEFGFTFEAAYSEKSRREYKALKRIGEDIYIKGRYPDQSTHLQEYEFLLKYEIPEENFSWEAPFTWYDYRGGLLTDRHAPQKEYEELENLIVSSDALVLFLDLTAFIHDAERISDDLEVINRLLTNTLSKVGDEFFAISIVLTKIDMLEDDECDILFDTPQWMQLMAIEKMISENPNVSGLDRFTMYRTRNYDRR